MTRRRFRIVVPCSLRRYAYTCSDGTTRRRRKRVGIVVTVKPLKRR